MRMTKRTVIMLSSLFMLLPSCGGKSEPNENLDVTKTTGDISEKDLVSVTKWIELENVDSALISNAKKVIKFKGDYYILDNIGRKAVLVFDKNGKYQHSVGKVGNGPGEYPVIEDFCINEINGNIGILSSASFLYLYDPNGNFIENKKLSDSLLWECSWIDNHYVFSTDHCTYTEGANAYLIYVFDHSFNEVGKYLNVVNVQMPRLEIFNGQLVSNGRKGYYMDVFTNNLYSITSPSFNPMRMIDVDFTSPMPLEIFSGGMSFFEKQNDYDWIMGFVPTQSNMILNYITKGEMRLAILNTDGKIEKNGRYLGLFPKSFSTSSDTIISPISLDEYFGFWSKTDYYIQCGMPKMTDESNMLLMEWTIGKDLL